MDRTFGPGGRHRTQIVSLICSFAFVYGCLVWASASFAGPTDTVVLSVLSAAGDADEVYREARSLEQTGKIQSAIQKYNSTLRLAPDHQGARRHLRRLERLGYNVSPPKSSTSLQLTALGPQASSGEGERVLDEKTQGALDRALQKARIYLDSEQPAEAERVLREAMRLAPDHPEVSKMLDEAAELRNRLAQQQQAREKQSQSERRKALSASASKKFEQGSKYYLEGDVIRAVETWREALATYPDHEPSKNAIEAARDEYQKALKAKEEAEKRAAEERKYEEKLDLKAGYETKGDSDIDDVLNTLSNLCGLKMVIGPGVEGTVSFRVDKDTTIREILNLIEEHYGFAWERKADTIVVKRAYKTRAFPLSETQYKTLKAILEDPSTLEDKSQDLQVILYGQDGSKKVAGKELFLNERTRSLVVTDTEENLAKVEEFLKHMPTIAEEDRPLETALFRLHPEVAKDLFNIIELRLYQEVGQYGGLTGAGRKLFLSEDNTLIVIDYPENIEIVKQILEDQQIQQALEEDELKAKHFAVTDMFDIGQREEDLDRRIQTTRMITEVLEAMLYGPTGQEEARLKGRRMFPNEERGTIDIVDTPANLKRVDDYLASLRGEAQQDIFIETFYIKHIPVTDIADAIGFIFFNQQQSSRNMFLDIQGLDTIGTDEEGQEVDLGTGYEESSRDLFNIQQGGGGQDLTQLFSMSFFPDYNTNSIVLITPDRDALDFVSNIINSFDKPPRMLEIEQRIVSVSLSDLRSVGLDYLILNPFRSKISVNPERSNQEVVLLDDESKQSLRFTMDTFGETRLNFVLNLLEGMDTAEVISAPKMLHVPNGLTTPLIFVGKQEPYIETAEIDDQGDDDPTNNRLVLDFQRSITGISLMFLPFILNDDHVYVELMPNKTEITNRLPVFVETGQQGGAGIDTSTLASLGQPVFTQQAMMASVRLKSGETVVMGGMMNDSVTESRLSVPLLSKLPLVGSLFQDVSYNVSKSTILWFLTVRIIEETGGGSEQSVNIGMR